MKLILSGELIDTTEANEIGLVDEVCDAETLDEGLEAARAAIDDGSAAAVLDDLRAF
jgi:enoyl-CoA hydratase/carnithine racemase